MVKKWIFGPKLGIWAIIAESLKNDSFWPQNHFFTIIPPKPAYIYPHNFSRENFPKQIFVPLDPPWGTYPYLRIPSIQYFTNVFFWTSWAPWASPYLQMLWDPSKNLKFFQGAVVKIASKNCTEILSQNQNKRIGLIYGASHHLPIIKNKLKRHLWFSGEQPV